MTQATKTRDLGSAGHIGILITDVISFLPLDKNNCDAMCVVIASLIDLLQSINQLYFTLYCIKIYNEKP